MDSSPSALLENAHILPWIRAWYMYKYKLNTVQCTCKLYRFIRNCKRQSEMQINVLYCIALYCNTCRYMSGPFNYYGLFEHYNLQMFQSVSIIIVLKYLGK